MKYIYPVLLLLAGCAVPNPNNITAFKATVFGLDVATDPVTQVPHFRLGMVRYFYQCVPTSTNVVYVPNYSSSTAATLGAFKQEVFEDFTTGDNPVTPTNSLSRLWSPLAVKIREIPVVGQALGVSAPATLQNPANRHAGPTNGIVVPP